LFLSSAGRRVTGFARAWSEIGGRAIFGALFSTIACHGIGETSDADAPACSGGVLGDGGSPDFQFLVLQSDDTVTPIGEDASVPIVTPPQGGRIVLVGVRATNVDGCGLDLTGALRDPQTQQVTFERRTVDLTPTGDGWGASGSVNRSMPSQISNFANVPVCPNEWSMSDIYDHTYRLEVTIRDRQGRELTKKIDVTPRCAAIDAQGCSCLCMAGYVLGQSCAEGGTEDGDAGAQGDP
jgi:hypothetical protein